MEDLKKAEDIYRKLNQNRMLIQVYKEMMLVENYCGNFEKCRLDMSHNWFQYL